MYSFTFSILLPFLFLYTIVFLAIKYVYNGLFHLRGVPGPWLGAYSRLWLLWAIRSERSPEIFSIVNARYGPVVRIAPNVLLINDPDTWKYILSPRSKYQRGPWFDCLRLDPLRANLITEQDRKTHNALRYKMASGYEGKDIDHFEETVDENLQEWIQWIQKSALSGPGRSEIFDIARSIQWLDFDLICRLCFGHCLNFIKSHSDQHDFQKVLEERLPIVEQFGVFMEVGSMIKFISRVPLLRKLLPSAEDKTGIGKIRGMARAALDARTNPDFTPRNDIPGAWLNKGVPRGQVETEMVIALFAGSDTTATSLRATLLYVISNPLVYARLTQEIRSVLKVNAIPAEEVVPNTLAKSLPYLQACIKEGLRIFPPVTAMRERLTPPEGDCLLGHKIPGGVRIGVSMRSLLRDKVAFAPDPEVFRPERWLECEAQVMQRMERVHELVFNWGFTRCLGINLASMMSSKFFVECFRRWDITLVTPETPWESRCHGVFYQKHFWVRISPTQLALSE